MLGVERGRNLRLHDFVVANLEPILQEWEVFARRADLTGQMDPTALRDHAKEMLLAIVRDMDSGQTRAERSSKSMGDRDAVTSSESMGDASRAHALDRAASGFKLGDVVSEYRALRASVLELWRLSGPGTSPENLADLVRFNEAIDQSLAMSTLAYTEAVDRGRQTFLAILGHDLRNPLAAIRMMATELARDERLDDDTRSMVAMIRDSAADMKKLVKDLIDFAGNEVLGAMPLSPAPMDLGDLCRQVVGETRAGAPDRQIDLHTRGDLSGRWDQARLRQALSNLLGNAVQHGSGPIGVSATSTGGARGESGDVVLRVHNGGEPIPPEALPLLFDPLTRAANAASAPRARARPGSLGLGLYIARSIISAHGGQVTVDSSREAGTTFTVCLPSPATSPPAPRDQIRDAP